jgi:hypothetical protein
MNRIYILIAVDVEGALAAGTLCGNVYLADTNKYLGSWQEGQSTLNTVCQDGQMLTWSAASIDPGDDVAIAGFSGALVESGVCRPKPGAPPDDTAWSGQILSRGQFASFATNIALVCQARQLGFTATVKVV